MWFIGVEVEQVSSGPLLKKILDPPLRNQCKEDSTKKRNICFKGSFVYIWLHHLRVIVSKSSGFVRNASQDDDLRTWHGKQIFMVVAKNWGVVSQIKSSCKVLKQEF